MGQKSKAQAADGGALYWFAVGIGTVCTFLMLAEWFSPKSTAKWWEPLGAAATACATGIALFLGTADARRRSQERKQNARILRVYLETELHTVRTAANAFLLYVRDGVISPTAPVHVHGASRQKRGAGRWGFRGKRRLRETEDGPWKEALKFCADNLAMPATQQQFEMISSLPGMQAAILAGVAAEAARLRSGLLEWRKRGGYVHINEALIQVFCRNASDIVSSINCLDWMGNDVSIRSYG